MTIEELDAMTATLEHHSALLQKLLADRHTLFTALCSTTAALRVAETRLHGDSAYIVALVAGRIPLDCVESGLKALQALAECDKLGAAGPVTVLVTSCVAAYRTLTESGSPELRAHALYFLRARLGEMTATEANQYYAAVGRSRAERIAAEPRPVG